MSAGDSPEDLLSRAATCRRIAQGMGKDPLAQNLIEMAEVYEELAAAKIRPANPVPQD